MAEVKSDIEIARAAKMKPIREIGAQARHPDEHLEPYGQTRPRSRPTSSSRSAAARTAS